MSQDPHTARRRAEILNGLGLHLRPAAKFVELANRFASEVRIVHNGEEIDGKSVISLATLAAERGTVLEIVTRGADAEAAVAALTDLVAARFYEDDDGQSVERAS